MGKKFSGEMLDQFLGEQRMTRQDLADKLGVSRSSIHRYIKG